jgi:cobalt-zinc-cadmium efflux system protein
MHAHHDHHHCHSHHGGKNKRRLAFTLVLAAGYMVAEVVGGLMTNSLALLADAGHMLSDVAALALSFFAVWIADRPAPPHRTYGYYRAEILAALANGAALVAVSIYILVEAFQRMWEPPDVQAPLMLWIACGGLLINLAGLWMLHGGRDENLNIRGAWLHVLSDTLGSVGVILAAGLIWAFGWYWSDPVASLIIGLLVIYSSWRLLAEATAVLMESAPRGIDVDEVRDAVVAMDGVKGIHDLHIWTIASGLDSLSAHVVSDDGQSHPDFLTRLRTMLHDRFGIDHITIQIEPEGFVERDTPI